MPAKNVVFALTAGALFGFVAMARAQPAPPPAPPAAPAPHAGMMAVAPAPTKAVAVLHPTKGSKVEGTVTFTATPAGVHVQAKITGLSDGAHGFHIHEFGDTSSADGMAAGGHYNPMARPHSAPNAPPRHVGDLGNIESKDGEATYDAVDPNLAFSGPASILGRGVVVHEKADDLKTQPTGNAGGRVAVGVIGAAKAAAPAAPK